MLELQAKLEKANSERFLIELKNKVLDAKHLNSIENLAELLTDVVVDTSAEYNSIGLTIVSMVNENLTEYLNEERATQQQSVV